MVGWRGLGGGWVVGCEGDLVAELLELVDESAPSPHAVSDLDDIAVPGGGEVVSHGGMGRRILSVLVENKLAVAGVVIIIAMALNVQFDRIIARSRSR